jgi:hypothetical protein
VSGGDARAPRTPPTPSRHAPPPPPPPRRRYWPDQKQYGDITAEQLAEVQGSVKELEVQLAELMARRKALAASLSDATASMTTSEIRARLAAVKAEVAEGRAKLDKLKSSTTLVTPAQRATAIATLDRFRKAWASRKGMVMEVVSAARLRRMCCAPPMIARANARHRLRR